MAQRTRGRPSRCRSGAGTDPLDQNGDGSSTPSSVMRTSSRASSLRRARRATIDIVSHNGSFVEHDAYGADCANPDRGVGCAVALEDAHECPTIGRDQCRLRVSDTAVRPASRRTVEWAAELDVPARSSTCSQRSPTFSSSRRPATRTHRASVSGRVPRGLSGARHRRRIRHEARTARARRGRSPILELRAWVACCTKGEDVVSSFVTGWNGSRPRRQSHEVPAASRQDVLRVGEWEGTSFAAPKVAGGDGPGNSSRAGYCSSAGTTYQASEALITGRLTGGLQMGRFSTGCRRSDDGACGVPG